MALMLARAVQDTLKLCSTCNNKGSNSTEQLVLKNDRDKVMNETQTTQTSTFLLTGLADAIPGSTATSSVSVSVSAEFLYESLPC